MSLFKLDVIMYSNYIMIHTVNFVNKTQKCIKNVTKKVLLFKYIFWNLSFITFKKICFDSLCEMECSVELIHYFKQYEQIKKYVLREKQSSLECNKRNGHVI